MMQQLLAQSNLVILGIASTNEQAGLYGAASRLAIFVPFAMTAAAGVTSSLIVKAHKDTNHHQLRRIFFANVAIALAGAGVVTLSFYLGGHIFLRAFGKGFEDAYGPLVVLSCAGILTAISGVCANVLLMTGHHRFLARAMVVAVIVQIAVSILVSSGYGAMGAALAVLISALTNCVSLMMGVRRVVRSSVTSK
jgi:O-antigen/teichoic acid export membrane protein